MIGDPDGFDHEAWIQAGLLLGMLLAIGSVVGWALLGG